MGPTGNSVVQLMTKQYSGMRRTVAVLSGFGLFDVPTNGDINMCVHVAAFRILTIIHVFSSRLAPYMQSIVPLFSANGCCLAGFKHTSRSSCYNAAKKVRYKNHTKYNCPWADPFLLPRASRFN